MTVARQLTTLVLLVATVGALKEPASAQPAPADDSTVREIVTRAQRHYDLGEYSDAIAGYREAYRLDPRPALFFNLGQAYRLAGDCVTAAFMYRSFLRLAPESKHRPLAEQQLAAIGDCERTQLGAGARPATVGDPEPEPAEPQPVPEPAVTAEPAAVQLDAVPPPPGRDGRGLRVAGGVTSAVGGVALGVGSYFAVSAVRASREVSDAYRDGSSWAEIDAIDARGQRAELAGAALLTVGAVAVATGATLYALGWRASRGTAATVVPGDGGAEVVVSWRF